MAERESFDAFLGDLLAADWEDPKGPLSLNPELQFADLAQVGFFINVRQLLSAIDELDGAPMTATGNLNRAFVAHLFERLKLPARTRETIRKYNKVINETDVWPLHLARVIAELGGLVARRKKRFRLTKIGRAVLTEDQAGALYRRLFLTYFRRFDLRYGFPMRDVPEIQQSFALILLRLQMMADDWTAVKDLAPQLLLPAVLDRLHAAMVGDYDREDWILSGFVFDPLISFGLLEQKNRGDWPKITRGDDIRISALWRKFIRFNYSSPGAGKSRPLFLNN